MFLLTAHKLYICRWNIIMTTVKHLCTHRWSRVVNNPTFVLHDFIHKKSTNQVTKHNFELASHDTVKKKTKNTLSKKSPNLCSFLLFSLTGQQVHWIMFAESHPHWSSLACAPRWWLHYLLPYTHGIVQLPFMWVTCIWSRLT